MPDEIKTDATAAKTDATATTATDAAKTDAKVETKTDAITIGGGKVDAGEVKAQADWPADWREKLAAGDEKKLARLKRNTDPGQVFTSYLELERKVSAKELKTAPPENGTEAEVTAWRKDNGIPEKPEGYLKDLPEGLVVGEEDKKLLGQFAADMHALNADPKFVQAAIASHYKMLEGITADQVVADDKYREKAYDALEKEWGPVRGPEFKGNLAAMHSLFDLAPAPAKNGDPTVKDLVLGARLADGTVLGDHPSTLRWLAAVGRELNPASTVVPGVSGNAVQSLDARKTEIEKVMRNDRAAYNKDENMQKEYREIIEAQQKIKARAA